MKASASPSAKWAGLVQPTLAFHFDEIHPELYLRLRNPSPRGVLLEELLAEHDSDRYTGKPTRWAGNRVIEFTDTNRPNSATTPLAGWFLGPRAQDDRETVVSVLLRDFKGGPSATSLEELLLGLQPNWPPPWELCRPTDGLGEGRGAVAVAYDLERGIKMGLGGTEDEAATRWRVDHVEFFSTRLPLDELWASKGYGSCEPIARVSVRGQFKELGTGGAAGE
ncbi:MAG: hypothetical protein VX498_03170 [Myxococcota bacterium]|nr:hypothetical protein [Myxococcota bacterium]